jgi:hypothetical protein
MFYFTSIYRQEDNQNKILIYNYTCSRNSFKVQGAAEWTPTFLKVTGKGVVGVGRHGRWRQFERIV